MSPDKPFTPRYGKPLMQQVREASQALDAERLIQDVRAMCETFKEATGMPANVFEVVEGTPVHKILAQAIEDGELPECAIRTVPQNDVDEAKNV